MLNIYHAKFHGRKKNAEGIFYDITTYCYGKNEEDARTSLYDQYEHVMHLVLTETPVVAAKDVPKGTVCYRIMRIAGLPRVMGMEDPHNATYKRSTDTESSTKDEPLFVVPNGTTVDMRNEEFIIKT